MERQVIIKKTGEVREAVVAGITSLASKVSRFLIP
jgi:hypothetical protein